MTDSICWIWFQLVFGIGSRRSRLMLDYFKSPKNILSGLSRGGPVYDMLDDSERGQLKTAMERAESIQRRTLKKGCSIVTPDDPAYPELLHNIYAKPAVLYVKGNLEALNDSLCIAVVGTRNCSEYGEKAAIDLSGSLAREGVAVVSGLANGIDAIAHRAALDSGGQTFGVLGCGIDVDYPRGSAELKRAICENGAVITEYPLGVEPRPMTFPLRNRIISGLSRGVVVVEADLESGALVTARHALDQGRDVFAVPGSIFSAKQRGAHSLIKEGAKAVENAYDILEEYGKTGNMNRRAYAARDDIEVPDERRDQPAEPQPRPAQRPADLPDALSKPARLVYDYMHSCADLSEITVDRVVSDLSLGVGEVQACLTELELFALIEMHPGRRFGVRHP